MQFQLFRSQRASALILVLISAGVLGAIALLLTNYLHRELAGLQRMKSFLQADNSVTRSLANDVSGLATHMHDTYLASVNGATVKINGSQNESLVVFARTFANGSANRTRSLLLSYRSVFPTSTPHANWQTITSWSSPSACHNWVDETNFSGTYPTLKSARTCISLDPIESSTSIFGNIRPSAPLIISNLHATTVRVFVTGFGEFSQGLHFEHLSDSLIEIIVGGKLSIRDIIVNSVSNTKLLLHSAQDGAEINFTAPHISLCETSVAGAVSLAVDSRRDIIINGVTRGTHTTVGCSMTRDENVWPKFVLLGRS